MVFRHYGVCKQQYKLMCFYQFDEWEFYDLVAGSDELVNQYKNLACAQAIDAMKHKFEVLRAEYEDGSDVSVKREAWQ